MRDSPEPHACAPRSSAERRDLAFPFESHERAAGRANALLAHVIGLVLSATLDTRTV
jgi:hypothetical protein